MLLTLRRVKPLPKRQFRTNCRHRRSVSLPTKPYYRLKDAPQPRKQANVPTSAFDALWRRIEMSAGESISTKRGQDFTYEIKAGYLTVRESGARIPRSQFKKALSQWPQTGPSNMRGIYASSVVWAVLADEQILANAA